MFTFYTKHIWTMLMVIVAIVVVATIVLIFRGQVNDVYDKAFQSQRVVRSVQQIANQRASQQAALAAAKEAAKAAAATINPFRVDPLATAKDVFNPFR